MSIKYGVNIKNKIGEQVTLIDVNKCIEKNIEICGEFLYIRYVNRNEK